MSVLAKFTKDPDAVLDYGIDWSSWMHTGDELKAGTPAVWTVPTGITLSSQEQTTTRAIIWLSGGTAGLNYDLACKITTVGGRVDERTITIKVRQR